MTMIRHLVCAVLVMALAGPSLADDAELEARIEAARAKLDAAAKELASLHASNWGSEGKRLMLGVLIDDRDREDGIVLSGITPGGGAEAAGLRAGDRLLAIDDTLLAHPNEVRSIGDALQTVTPGDSVMVRYSRAGKESIVELIPQPKAHNFISVLDGVGNIDLDLDFSGLEELGEMIDMPHISVAKAPRPPAPPAPVRLMAIDGSLARYFDVDSGVLVLELDAAIDGLEEGDVLREVDGKPIRSVRQGMTALRTIDDSASVTVVRDGREKTVSLPAFAEDLAWVSDTRPRVESRVIKIDRD